MPEWKTPLEKIEIGKGRKLLKGSDLAILSVGHIGNYAEKACLKLEAKNISASLYDMRFIKPLDEELLHEVFQNHKLTTRYRRVRSHTSAERG